MVFSGIRRYSPVFAGIRWYSGFSVTQAERGCNNGAESLQACLNVLKRTNISTTVYIKRNSKGLPPNVLSLTLKLRGKPATTELIPLLEMEKND